MRLSKGCDMGTGHNFLLFLFCYTHFGASRSWILACFFFCRFLRSLGKRFPTFLVFESCFDDTIFQRVESDDSESCSRCENPVTALDRLFERLDLVIHDDAQSLECSRRRMDASAFIARWNRLFDDPCEFRRACDATALTSRHNRVDDTLGKLFLSEFADQLLDLVWFPCVDDVSGRETVFIRHRT